MYGCSEIVCPSAASVVKGVLAAVHCQSVVFSILA